MTPSPETISKCIRVAVDKAMANGLVRPTALYLGEEEDKALTAYAEKHLGFISEPTDTVGWGIRTYEGMIIHRVVEPSHLGVA